MANSASGSGQKSEISSTTPWPASATPSAIASSSSARARRDGVGSPDAVRWFSVRDVENPIAPARRASVASARMAAVSSSVASSRRAARSPMTKSRSAPWGSCAHRSMSCGRRPTASRYSPKLSHVQSIPSSSTAPGMSSTPSMSEMRRSCASGRTGAKPTPQLPITAVVTPCQLLGVIRESQVACPS